VGTALEDNQLILRMRAVSIAGDLKIVEADAAPARVGVGFDLPLDLGGEMIPDMLGYVARVLSDFEDVLGP
jgi:hypothetical protein